MAIKKVTTKPTPTTVESPLPNFDKTRTELSPEELMDQAVKESKSGFEKLPTGNFVAVVDNIDYWESEKGCFYRIHLVVNVEDNPTFRHTIFCHMLMEDKRTPHEWGPVFYARHLAVLGYSKSDDQRAVREEIKRTKPGVIISCQPNKRNPEWNDVAIRDRIGDDNEEVQQIKEALDSTPY
jgi:hypothetical protein